MGYKEDALFVFGKLFNEAVQILLGKDIKTIAGLVKDNNLWITD